MRPPSMISNSKDLYYHCKLCNQYLNIKLFHKSSIQRKDKRCIACKKMRNRPNTKNKKEWSDIDRLHQDLRKRQKKHQKNNKNHPNMHFIKRDDLVYIINNIWEYETIHKIKATTQSEKKNNIFIEWNPKEPFSPWNIIYISKTDAKTHKFIKDRSLVYSKEIINLINSKFDLVKMYYQKTFPKMPTIDIMGYYESIEYQKQKLKDLNNNSYQLIKHKLYNTCKLK